MKEPLLDPRQALLHLSRLASRRRDQTWKLRRFLEGRLDVIAPMIVEAALETGSVAADLFARMLEEKHDPALARRILPLLPTESAVLFNLILTVHALALTDPDLTTEEEIHLGLRVSRLLANAGMTGIDLKLAQAAALARETIPSEVEPAFCGLRPEILANPALFQERTGRQLILHTGDAQREKASSLRVLSDRLREAGRVGEALAAAQEAVTILRPLQSLNYGWSDGSLPVALISLSLCFLEAGRLKEAWEAAEEAAEKLRSLALAGPLWIVAELARARNTTGVILLQLGRFADARAATEDAVRIYQEACVRDRDAFLPDLALCMGNLVGIHLILGTPKEAMAAGEAALELQWQLFHTNRKQFMPSLARSLFLLSLALQNAERDGEALPLLETAGGLALLSRSPKSLIELVRHDYVQIIAKGSPPGEWNRLRAELDEAERSSLAKVIGQFCQDSAIQLFQAGRSREAMVVCLRGIAVFEDVADGGGASAGYGLLSSEARDDGRVQEAADWAIRCYLSAQGAKHDELNRAFKNFLLVVAAVGAPGTSAAWERVTGAPLDVESQEELELEALLIRNARGLQVPWAPVARRLGEYLESRGWSDLAAITELELAHPPHRVPPIPPYPRHPRQLARLVVDIAEKVWHVTRKPGTADLSRIAESLRADIGSRQGHPNLYDLDELVSVAVAAAIE